MPISVKHNFVDPIADDPSFAGVRPSHWNDGHAVTGAEASLGNPSVDGYLLSSTILGVRSWVAPGTGSMVYPGAGIANSTGAAWGTSYTTSGSGTVLALTNSPVFTTPNIDAATAASINGSTVPSSVTLAANNGSNWTIAGQAIGDLAVASSTTAYGKLADVAVGQVLVSGGVGVAPAWSASPAMTSPTVSLPAQNSNSTVVPTTSFIRRYTQPMFATPTVLTPSASITWTPVVGTNIYTLTPNATGSINMGVIGAQQPGQTMILIITTSGASSFTITFGANLKSQGTLATGTVSGATFIVEFLILTTSSVIEIARTIAM